MFENFECKKCDLCKQGKKNYVLPHGNINGTVLIVGEAPGSEEDIQGKPFVGPSGTLLRQALEAAKLPMSDIFITNTVFCRPPKNRQPKKEELKACSEYLEQVITSMPNLKIIMPLGAVALQATLNRKGVTECRGTTIKDKKGRTYVPTFHPAAILRDPNKKDTFFRDFSFVQGVLSNSIKSGTYHLCDTMESVTAALATLTGKEYMSFDIETSSIDEDMSSIVNDEIVGVSFTTEEYTGYYIPFISVNQPVWDDTNKAHIVAELKRILTAPTMKIVLHNGKFDANFLKARFDIDIMKIQGGPGGASGMNYFFDTLLAHHILWQEPPHGLKHLARRFPDLAYYESELEAYKKENKIKNYAMIPKEVMYKYAAGDADATWRLFILFYQELKDKGLLSLMFTHAMPLTIPLAQAEYRGVKMDRKWMQELGIKLDNQVALLKSEIYKLAGEEFNINSGPQKAKILFEKMGLPMPKRLTKTDQIPTDKNTLKNLHHPLADKMIEYAKIVKLKSTFVTSLLEKLDAQDVIRTGYKIHGTSGARLCVSGDTRLVTDKGCFEISDGRLTKDTKCSILTHAGRYMPVINKYYKGKEDMYEVALDSGESIKCTAGHRFLTPNGWRHLHELAEGSEVYTYDNSPKKGGQSRKMADNGRGEFLPHFYPRRTNQGKNTKKVQIVGARSALDAGILGRKIQVRAGSNKTQALCGRASGEYARGDGTSVRTCRQEKTKGRCGFRVMFISIIQALSGKRIFDSAKYGLLQTSSGLRASGTNAEHRLGVFEKVRNFCSRFNRLCKTVLQKSNRVFRQIVSGVSSIGPDGLVHSGYCAHWHKVQSGEGHAQKSYSMELEQVRNVIRSIIVGFKDTPRQAVVYSPVEASRLLFSSGEFNSGDGRRISRNGNAGERQIKGGRGSPPRNINVKNKGKRFLEKPGEVCFSNTIGIIKSIKPIGEQDVWDIEVEGDHSYCAQGFINHNSSGDPNLQNIPGKSDFRGMFITRPGYAFVSSDFSQIELRVLAVFSQDPKLLRAYWNNEDIHDQVAHEVFNVPEGVKAPKDIRRKAKAVSFGIVYGIGPKGLAEQTQTDEDTAGAYINQYMFKYRGVYQFQEYVKAFVHEHKFVKDMFGRVCHIPSIDSPERAIVGEAERTALNIPIQSTAGDITNICAVRLHFALQEAGIDAHLALTVHDELCYEVRQDQILQAAKLIHDTMRATAEQYLKIPVLVEQWSNSRWVDYKTLSPDAEKVAGLLHARFLKKLGIRLRDFVGIARNYKSQLPVDKKQEVAGPSV